MVRFLIAIALFLTSTISTASAYCELAPASGRGKGCGTATNKRNSSSNNGAAIGLAIGSILLQRMQKSDEDIRDDVQRELNENHRRYQQEMKDAAKRASAAESSAQGADGTNPWGKPPPSKSQEKNPDTKATRRSVDCDDLQQFVESYIPLNVKDRPAQLKERWETTREDNPRYMSCKQSYDTYHSFDEKTQQTDTASAASSAPSQKSGSGSGGKVSKVQGNDDHSNDLDPVTKKPCVQATSATWKPLYKTGKRFDYTFTNSCKRRYDITIFTKSGWEGFAAVNGFGKAKWFCTDGHKGNKDCGGGINGFNYH